MVGFCCRYAGQICYADSCSLGADIYDVSPYWVYVFYYLFLEEWRSSHLGRLSLRIYYCYNIIPTSVFFHYRQTQMAWHSYTCIYFYSLLPVVLNELLRIKKNAWDSFWTPLHNIYTRNVPINNLKINIKNVVFIYKEIPQSIIYSLKYKSQCSGIF